MKKLFLILVGIFLISCVKIETIPTKEDVSYPLEEQVITVPTGKAVVVKSEIDTLAVVTKTNNILVPKNSNLSYSEIDNSNNNLEERYKTWQTVAFEDSRVGDYDYNDLVIHTRIEQKSKNTQISIHPIALGSTKNITLGITIEGKDYIISSNCRKDLFEEEKGFINTSYKEKRIKYEKFSIKNYPTSKCTYGKSLDWFILVDNNLKLYAVSKNYPSKNRPYGLIFVNIHDYPFEYKGWKCGLDWFDYPSESVSIESVYPYFFDNKSFKEIYSNKQQGFYNAIDLINNIKATDNCLYAIDEYKSY